MGIIHFNNKIIISLMTDINYDLHPGLPVLDFNNIADGIYIGTNQCCQTHFDDILRNENGITADISLEKEKIDMPFGVDFYLWLPVENHRAPMEDQIYLGATAIEKLVEMGRRVYVHCQNGHGRAPTLVAAYLIRKGMDVNQAIDFIKSKRPGIHLEDEQVQALIDFKAKQK